MSFKNIESEEQYQKRMKQRRSTRTYVTPLTKKFIASTHLLSSFAGQCRIIGRKLPTSGFFLSQSVQSLSHVWFFVTPWTAACQASLSITNSRSPPKPMSIESVMPFSHLTLCRPLLLLPPVPPSIRVFASESALHTRWPKYRSFSFNISPSNEHPGQISFRMD